MHSRCFPVGGRNGKKLKNAVSLVEEVIRDLYEDIYSTERMQFENCAFDGEALGMLSLARKLIEERIK